MGLKNLGCDISGGTTQGQVCPNALEFQPLFNFVNKKKFASLMTKLFQNVMPSSFVNSPSNAHFHMLCFLTNIPFCFLQLNFSYEIYKKIKFKSTFLLTLTSFPTNINVNTYHQHTNIYNILFSSP
jgi:hypothetical protein